MGGSATQHPTPSRPRWSERSAASRMAAVGQRNREAVETASPEASARQLGAAVSRALVG